MSVFQPYKIFTPVEENVTLDLELGLQNTTNTQVYTSIKLTILIT